MGIEQKVAIITGASQGIGAALVQGFRDRNYRVVATARSIKPSGDDDVLAVAGDIADRATAERVVHQALARFGRVDTLVNNAGIFVAKPFTQYSPKDYAAVMGNERGGLLQHHAACHRRDGEAGRRTYRSNYNYFGRPSKFECALGFGLLKQGRLKCGNQVACDRVRQARYPS